MNGLAQISLVVSMLVAGVALAVVLYDGDPPRKALGAAGVALGCCLALVGAVWSIAAHIVSPYQDTKCQQKADAYGLEDGDWSMRFGCRVRLATGQVVPEDRIRITTDGQIVVSDEED